MDNLLANLMAEGQQESQGEWTLDPQAAHRKLGTYGFEIPGLYVLKLVQAAHALRARKIVLSLGPVYGRVEIEGDIPYDRDFLLDQVENPLASQPDPALGYLAWAWQSMKAQGAQHVDWRLAPERLECRFRRPPSRSFKETVSRYVGGSLEMRFIKARCRFAPIPIFVQWDRINMPERLYQIIPASDPMGPFVMAERLVFGEGGRVLAEFVGFRNYNYLNLGEGPVAVPQPGSFAGRPVLLYEWATPAPMRPEWHKKRPDVHFMPWKHDKGYYTVDPADLEGRTVKMGVHRPTPSAVLLICLQGHQPGFLIMVRHGVAIECKRLDLGSPGAFAMMACDHLRTDLSQMSVVEDEAFEQAVDELRRHYRELAANLQPLLPTVNFLHLRRG